MEGGTGTPEPIKLQDCKAIFHVISLAMATAGGGVGLRKFRETCRPSCAYPPTPPRLASMQVTGSVTSASPAPAQQTWRRWRPPPTWACPGAGRSESMMPRCAWGAAAIQVRGWSQRLRAVGVRGAQGVGE